MATAQLKLVHPPARSAPSSPHMPRPVKVYYEGGGVGSCKSVGNALCSATRRVILTEARKANVYVEDVHVADVVRSGYQVLVKWRKGLPF